MAFIPIMLNLTGKKCLVIGGGKVAARKLKYFVNKADVTVIAKNISKEIKNTKGVMYIEKEYSPGDLEGFDVVIITTNDKKLNEKIHHEAKKKKILTNNATSKIFCEFIMPAIIEYKGYTISISTNGENPKKVKQLKEKIKKFLEGLDV
ncbi:siroheme synthase [Thermosipho melanesiensis]|uniref:precorrin-2 dehydrogenase n=2 Tax=Thermosipho melanesiensis TaxID=46541 RepID=A6LKX3_THEM4|nr:bifunctional precorrin-2 dehydrogenase/sirohydrochlorin ferrochelatase [Thermosipho melanesiensis]ABR30574.1 Siroheme synthase (precorrin-2 oxidase/ferrochelatase domain)-like protein [Thermosipho melanesiensis BI429]APT73722.1 siroheme synthase [Thermosipho melanesiensis]OOC35660.1 siroheme synthase [Thermosipho melanesiensis]OOC38959.1 siroheme synthase [Thermosipho melanesiensis]OOC39107.1 siroheme synthase [Thermosipho melanesiensis]